MAWIYTLLNSICLLILFTACSQTSLCSCKRSYYEKLQKKSAEKNANIQEKNTDAKEIDECINLWKNANIEEQKEILDETKKCR